MKTTGLSRGEAILRPSTTNYPPVFQQLRVISSMQEKSYLKVNQPITGENGAHLSICLPMTILKLLSHTEKKILVLHTCYMLKLLSLWR